MVDHIAISFISYVSEYEGDRQHFILGTSDCPISVIDDRTRENLIRFIETGIKYGTFDG